MQEDKNLKWRKVLQLDFYSTSTPGAATCLMPWKLYRSKFHPWCTPPEYQRTPFVALGPSSACTSHLWSTIHLYAPWSRRILVVQRPATPQISYCQAPRCLNWIEISTFEPHGEPWINQNHPPKCDLPIRMIYQSIHPTKKKEGWSLVHKLFQLGVFPLPAWGPLPRNSEVPLQEVPPGGHCKRRENGCWGKTPRRQRVPLDTHFLRTGKNYSPVEVDKKTAV